jgi:hypothetical protein
VRQAELCTKLSAIPSSHPLTECDRALRLRVLVFTDLKAAEKWKYGNARRTRFVILKLSDRLTLTRTWTIGRRSSITPAN